MQWERYNRTLLDMLGTLTPNKKNRTENYISIRLYMLTTAPGLSPGRNPRLAIGEFGINKTEWKSTSKYIND